MENSHSASFFFQERIHLIRITCFSVRQILFSIELLLYTCILVRKDFFPLCRADYGKSKLCFKIRLIKARNNSIRIVRLELSIDILLVININKIHTSTSIIVIDIFVMNSYVVTSD